MTLDEIDKSELIQESYRMEGVLPSECRSIFLDWALKLPSELDPKRAIEVLINTYVKSAPDHPMSHVLTESLRVLPKPVRRGGRGSRSVD